MIGNIGLQLTEQAVAKPPKAKPKIKPLFAKAETLADRLPPILKEEGNKSRLTKPKQTTKTPAIIVQYVPTVLPSDWLTKPVSAPTRDKEITFPRKKENPVLSGDF